MRRRYWSCWGMGVRTPYQPIPLNKNKRMTEPTNVEWKESQVLEDIANVADKRIICLYGGSSSSKTISALQYLTTWALESPDPLVLTVIGESIPVLKKSVIRDWQRVVMRRVFDRNRFNKLELTYTFDNGSLLQFIPADEEARFYSIRHDIVLIDEAYHVTKGIFDQVEIRTRKQILLTWNPVSPFWATKLEDERDDVAVIHATYHKNPFVEQAIIDSLERRAKTDPNFYRVFVLGKYGTLEGLIFKQYTHWNKCDEMPEDFKRRILVLDYGFTNDPTAILDLRYSDGEFWVDELEYKPGMFNSDIFNLLQPITGKRMEVIADSAEPKSNAELRKMGLNVIPSVKGPDSVKYGINTMKGFKLNVTKSSLNTIKELRNYSWKKDRQGEFTGEPVDNWNHSCDCARYIISHIRRKPNFGSYAVS